MTDGVCVRCGHLRKKATRGLCWPCHRACGHGSEFPPLRRGGSRGVGNGHGGYDTPTPTHHLPGSEGKLVEMEVRCLAGQSLFHPEDAKSCE